MDFIPDYLVLKAILGSLPQGEIKGFAAAHKIIRDD